MLHNIGMRAAIEVAQLYISFPEAAQEPPKILKGSAVCLNAGASTSLTSLNGGDVSIWDSNLHAWRVPSGHFVAMVGASNCDIRLNASFTW